MPRFIVTLTATQVQHVLITAKDADDAILKVKDGEGDGLAMKHLPWVVSVASPIAQPKE